MADNLGTSVSVSSGGDETYYVPGHPRYDAVRLDLDSGNTSADDVDVDFRTYDAGDVRDAKDNGDYSSMDEVDSFDAVDASSSDQSVGTEALGRVVAVKVDDTTGTGSDGVSGSIVLHESDDAAQNGHAFLNRHSADA